MESEALVTRHGDWITTYSGGKFWPLDPQPEDVLLEDVAHALSLLCRFTGHVARFYSVAEHSVLVSRLVPRRLALAGLLHDAAEAYVADVSSPVKHSEEFAAYRTIEQRIQAAVYRRFGVPEEMNPEVHRVDGMLCSTEARLLFREPPVWALATQSVPAPVVGLAPRAAERLFLERFEEVRA